MVPILQMGSRWCVYDTFEALMQLNKRLCTLCDMLWTTLVALLRGGLKMAAFNFIDDDRAKQHQVNYSYHATYGPARLQRSWTATKTKQRLLSPMYYLPKDHFLLFALEHLQGPRCGYGKIFGPWTLRTAKNAQQFGSAPLPQSH